MMSAAMEAIKHPIQKYRRLRDYRHHRINDAPVTWSSSAWKRLHPSLQQGYKYCLGIVASIWVLVLVFSIWVGTVHKAQAGLVFTLQTGSCSAAESINFWVHLVVNGIASTLYAISSFVMQRLAAPSREDIDRGHNQTPLLTTKIGSLAIGNFIVLSKKRLVVFFLLWISSLPLHLLFNSVIVYTATNAEWPSIVFMVSEEEFRNTVSNTSTPVISSVRQYDNIPEIEFDESDFPGITFPEWQLQAQVLFHQQPPMVDLRLDQCIDTFSSGSSETWGDVILVYSTESSNPVTLLKQPPAIKYTDYLPTVDSDPWDWMCGGDDGSRCDAKNIMESGQWTIGGLVIARCLARTLPEVCELNASLAILIAVLAAVSIKFIAISFAVILGRQQSLLTVGDAVASFLENPDKSVSPPPKQSYQCRKRMVMLEMKGAFWAAAIFGVLGLSLAWWFFAFVFRETSTAFSNSKTPFDFNAMLRYGFGKMPTRWSQRLNEHLLSYSDAQNPSFTYTSGAALANLPQLALSAYYLVFNNYVTRLFVALEFRAYSTRRRGLRVSQPVKNTKQRRAYFLQIPLRYSLLSIALFALLHTFLSQTLFLRRVYAIYPESSNTAGKIGKKLLPVIGYSPVGGFAFAVLLTSLVLSGIIIGLISVDWRMLDTSGHSLAISLACHPPEGTCNTHEGAVRWGVTNKFDNGDIKCSFSPLPVRPPDPGEVITTFPQA
ncbi:hypothetical protein F5Y08DRAFT_353847 [Xylaria arbuscula]|nr:hypothetical protein F5Y08DRAFT_353847 [Xylaria arbuscula]